MGDPTSSQAIGEGRRPPARRRARLAVAGVLANRSFAALWMASQLSALGSQVSRVGLLLYLFEVRGSVPHLAWLVLLESLPGTLAAPWAGAVADRYSKRGVMIAADLARLALLGLLLARPSLGVIYTVAALHSIATVFHQPAKAAAVPLIVRRDELTRANGLDQGAANLILVVGPVAGAALLARCGLAATLLVDAASFLASALLLTGVEVRSVAGLTGGERPAAPIAAAGEGWHYLWRQPVVRHLLGLFFVSLLATGLWTPVAPFFLRDRLGGPAELFGWQLGATGLGAIAGAVWAPAVAARLGRGRAVVAALAAEGATMALYSQISHAAASTALMLLWGVVVSLAMVPFYALVQSAVDERCLGRVFAVVKQSESCALAAAMGLAVALVDFLSPPFIFLAAGTAYSGFVLASSLAPSGRALLATR